MKLLYFDIYGSIYAYLGSLNGSVPGLTRWYDPYIAHFAQADSVLDNPITGWDRYSYVQNNPLRFIDPSGHKCENEEECDYVNFHNQSDPNAPHKVDGKLTKGGQDFYYLYLRMWKDRNGWWWDRYGSGGFTIWEFMAVMWGYEQAGYPKTRNVASAMANRGAWWCQTQNCDIKSTAGGLNFFAEFSYSVQSRVSDVLTKGESLSDNFYTPPSYWNPTPMQIVVSIHQRPSGSVNRRDLFDFGNVSLSNEILGKMIKRGMVYDYWGDGNTFVVMTKCQAALYQDALSNGGSRYITGANYKLYCGG